MAMEKNSSLGKKEEKENKLSIQFPRLPFQALIQTKNEHRVLRVCVRMWVCNLECFWSSHVSKVELVPSHWTSLIGLIIVLFYQSFSGTICGANGSDSVPSTCVIHFKVEEKSCCIHRFFLQHKDLFMSTIGRRHYSALPKMSVLMQEDSLPKSSLVSHI